MTFSILRAPYGDPLVEEFENTTDAVFIEAETSRGFIERANPVADIGWMTNFQKDWGRWGPFAVPRFYLGGVAQGHTAQAQTLSRWTDLAALRSFVYRGPLHTTALKNRGEWFKDQNWPIYCVWWADARETLNWQNACRRLEYLHDHGSTPASFTLRQAFDEDGLPLWSDGPS
jgi:hypothetical protein